MRAALLVFMSSTAAAYMMPHQLARPLVPQQPNLAFPHPRTAPEPQLLATIAASNNAQHHLPRQRWSQQTASLVRWLSRASLFCAAFLIPRLLVAAVIPAPNIDGLKPTSLGSLGRLPTSAEIEGYLLPFFGKWFSSKNMVLRYGSIPVVAGLLNWATNRLAILMMFYPLRFRGIGRIGWHGIVPSKATSMANRIVDDVMLRLIDLRTVFARLPPDDIADALEPVVLRIGDGLARDLVERKGLGALGNGIIGSSAFNNTLRERGRSLVADFVRDVQVDPSAVFDLRGIVVDGVANDPKVLVNLFERCGEQDLRFVVKSGLFLGGLLGVGQMLLWMAWSPWWSLAITGAAVGMVTDQLALKLIFEPVEPRQLGPFKLQGLFLKRQDEVSQEFAEFMSANVLNAPRLWQELLSGSRSSGFWRLLALRVDSALGVAPDGGLPNFAGQTLYQLLGKEDWEWLRKEAAARLRKELPGAVPAVYELTEESLQLKATMVDEMGKLTSAEFERVLHPVFEEDEWTLILVGTALGGIAGAAQAAF